jgi:hypothetical protein
MTSIRSVAANFSTPCPVDQEVTHSNGLGQSYADCAPRGAVDQTEAAAAANAWAQAVHGFVTTGVVACGTDGQAVEASTVFPMQVAVWEFQGPAFGRVHVDTTPTCPTINDPIWGF